MNVLHVLAAVPEPVWGGIGTGIAAILSAMAARWGKQAKEEAQQARANTVPMANGWAPTVLEHLATLHNQLNALEARAEEHRHLLADHLSDHTRGSLRGPRRRFWR